MTMRPGWSVVPMLLVLAGPLAAQGGDWTTYGGNDWNQRYSTLKQISTSNVAQLVPRKIFQTGITRLGSFENTPIAAAVAEVNRYSSKPIELRDQRISSIRVSGAFNTGDVDGFVAALRDLYHLEAVTAADGHLILSGPA